MDHPGEHRMQTSTAAGDRVSVSRVGLTLQKIAETLLSTLAVVAYMYLVVL